MTVRETILTILATPVAAIVAVWILVVVCDAIARLLDRFGGYWE